MWSANILQGAIKQPSRLARTVEKGWSFALSRFAQRLRAAHSFSSSTWDVWAGVDRLRRPASEALCKKGTQRGQPH